MTDRLAVEHLLVALYAARERGDLATVCGTFTSDAKFRIAGASSANPITITAVGEAEYRPLLAMMIKTFKLSDQTILAMLIDGQRAAVHWRARVFSRITGTTAPTELMDMVEVRGGRIASYTEVFVPG